MTPEAQAALQEAQRPEAAGPDVEVRTLREALQDAVQALARRGITPAAFAALPEADRCEPVWQEAARVWRAAAVDFELPVRVVLRSTNGAEGERREYTSPQVALEAAIAAIELNAGYPEAIEVDGRCVMDRASILRAWEDRHDPG